MAPTREGVTLTVAPMIHFELPSGQNTAMTGYDPALWVDQNRVREPKFPDAPGDLGHLSRRMRPRIPRIRYKILYLSILNSERFYSLGSCRHGSYARGGDIDRRARPHADLIGQPHRSRAPFNSRQKLYPRAA